MEIIIVYVAKIKLKKLKNKNIENDFKIVVVDDTPVKFDSIALRF
jgi:hypothetical protein